MHEAFTLYRERGAEALWERSLGFLDQSVADTLAVQNRRLEEHLSKLSASPYGQWLFRGARPSNYRELCQAVPLTEYEYYADTLGERREELFAEKPVTWIRTSGRSTGKPRWIPLFPEFVDAAKWASIGVVLASEADGRGDVRLRPGHRLLNLFAPPPYASGTIFKTIEEGWPVRVLPPSTPDNDALPFDLRSAMAFRMAATEGVDWVGSLAPVLVAVGESFASRRPPGTLLERLKNHRALRRMVAAMLKARVAGRPVYPRDAWKVRGVVTGGTDSSLFRERVREYWGRYPLEVFASTEAILVGMQAWDYTAFTLVPHLNFFEFVSEDELEKEAATGAAPRTVLMDELEVGRNYELVITNLHGGPLVRYRTGDIMRVTARSNGATGAELPQLAHYSRRSDLLEIGGFVRLTESTIWKAIELAGIPYTEWTARKEIEGADPVLHVRLEPRVPDHVSAEDARARIDRALSQIDSDWADMRGMARLDPLRVTFLPAGAFQRYAQRKQAEGADLAHLKPVHMNAADAVIETLLETAAAR